jgi:cytoskeletal protein CcmA (bactofilin family)
MAASPIDRSPDPLRGPAKNGSSTLGRGTIIRGSVRGDGDLDIHGRVEGSVDVAGDLLIAETALIKSDVSGRRVVVRGAVAGNVSGTESLVLEAGAKVVGDLSAPSIGIRPGALVRGNVSTDSATSPRRGSSTQPGTERPVAVRRPAVAAQSSSVRGSATTARAPTASAPAARPAATTSANASASAPSRAAAPAPSSRAAVPAAAEKPAAPPPVVPTLKKGAKAQLRKKGAR